MVLIYDDIDDDDNYNNNDDANEYDAYIWWVCKNEYENDDADNVIRISIPVNSYKNQSLIRCLCIPSLYRVMMKGDDYIGAIEWRWVIGCDCWYDMSDTLFMWYRWRG